MVVRVVDSACVVFGVLFEVEVVVVVVGFCW